MLTVHAGACCMMQDAGCSITASAVRRVMMQMDQGAQPPFARGCSDHAHAVAASAVFAVRFSSCWQLMPVIKRMSGSHGCMPPVRVRHPRCTGIKRSNNLLMLCKVDVV